MATTWWQALNARKDRLAELEVQLTHQRLLRDESVRRTAMLELVYVFRRFSYACVEAQRHHEHDEKISSQTDSPVIRNLIKLGQTSIDLLDKDASLIDKATRDALEAVRDIWETIIVLDENFDGEREDLFNQCCLLGGDFEEMELTINHGVRALEKQLDLMRFI